MKIIYFVTEDWYFVSHRLDLAKKAMKEGYEVILVTQISSHQKMLEELGIKVIPFSINRSGINIFADIYKLFQLIRIYRAQNPDIVHHVAVKPVIYGTLAAKAARIKLTINALAGLGFVFTSESLKARLLKPIVKWLLGATLKKQYSKVVVQNHDDFEQLIHELGLNRQSVKLIRGAGIDPEKYHVSVRPELPVKVVLLARMLKDKGIYEFVEAAKRLKSKGVLVAMVLVGDVDPKNPSSLSESQLEAWKKEGIVEWYGYRSDIQNVWDHAHISVLPSYREGLPKSLLESSACGVPAITSDVPGCREVVKEGVNGLLVPAKDSVALALAIEVLCNDHELRERMGVEARQLVETQFSSDIVDAQIMNLYRGVE